MRVEKIGDATLYLGDCREVLPALGKVDAVVTDPPFFTPAVHYQSRTEHQRSWADVKILEQWWAGVCDDLLGISAEGHCLVFANCDSYAAFYPPMFNRWRKVVSLVWDKEHFGMGRIWRHQHELIIAARGGAAYDANDGVGRADVLRHRPTPSASRLHPVEKPVSLLKEIVPAVAPIGGVVCDPFMGGCSTGVAAIRLGRRFIGIEIEPRYFDIACRRIEAEVNAPRLDLGEPAPRPEQASIFAEAAT